VEDDPTPIHDESEPQPPPVVRAATEPVHEPATLLRNRVEDAQAAYQKALYFQERASETARRAEREYHEVLQRYAAALERDLHEAQQAGPILPRSTADAEVSVDMVRVLRNLRSRSARERIEAKQTMQELGVRAVGPLLSVIARENGRRDVRLAIAGGFAAFCIVLAVGQMVAAGDGRLNSAMDAAWFLNALLIPALGSLFHFMRPTPLQHRAAQALADLEDVRVIGPLVEALALPDNFTRKAAAAGLKRLLPKVRASDATYFSREHMEGLYGILNSSDGYLVEVVLAALEQIGDEKALPHVERLVERPAYSSEAVRVQRAAKHCLPALLVRTDKGRQSQSLLRAASQSDSPSGDLLRPVGQPGASAPEQLLRPGTSPEG
jgi:hypothetical protein